MIVFSHYPTDVRVRREAETLIEAGMDVDLICLRKPTHLPRETVYDVRIFRVNLERRRSGKFRYLWEYIYFTMAAMLLAGRLRLKNRYQMVHVHNMPDVLVFSALFPRLGGAKVLLDIHDPVPEVFITKYGLSMKDRLIRVMAFLEKISIGFADYVVTPNRAFRNLFISRGCPPQKIDIVMNTPMERIFVNDDAEAQSAKPAPPKAARDKFRVMYHGTIVERNGLGDAVEAMVLLRDRIPGLSFEVYGSGDYVQAFQEKVKALKVEDIVHYHGFVTNERIANDIPSVDLGIIPNQKTPFSELNFPVRIFEYLALNRAVIVPATRGILDYFDENSLFYFEAGNPADLADRIEAFYRRDDAENQAILKRAIAVYQQHRWQSQRRQFTAIAHGLAGGRRYSEIENKSIRDEAAHSQAAAQPATAAVADAAK